MQPDNASSLRRASWGVPADRSCCSTRRTSREPLNTGAHSVDKWEIRSPIWSCKDASSSISRATPACWGVRRNISADTRRTVEGRGDLVVRVAPRRGFGDAPEARCRPEGLHRSSRWRRSGSGAARLPTCLPGRCRSCSACLDPFAITALGWFSLLRGNRYQPRVGVHRAGRHRRVPPHEALTGESAPVRPRRWRLEKPSAAQECPLLVREHIWAMRGCWQRDQYPTAYKFGVAPGTVINVRRTEVRSASGGHRRRRFRSRPLAIKAKIHACV